MGSVENSVKNKLRLIKINAAIIKNARRRVERLIVGVFLKFFSLKLSRSSRFYRRLGAFFRKIAFFSTRAPPFSFGEETL